MFKCDKCGLCCKNLQLSEIYSDLHNGDGICKYLKENECSIYENRPLLCRVDECYEKIFKKLYSIEEYYEFNYKICKYLKNEQN